MNDEERAEIRRVAHRLFGMSELNTGNAKVANHAFAPAIAENCPDQRPDRLWRAALRELERRRMRSRHLPSEIFGEGAWNILLDLFDSDRRGKDVSITSACAGANVSTTTALRQIAFLTELGLVRRFDDPSDGRRQIVRLTPEGMRAMTDVLAAFASAEIRADARIAPAAGTGR